MHTPSYGTFTVRSLQANPWGLYNVLGNVAEWTDELGSNVGHNEPAAALRGGHWASRRDELHLSVREWVATSTRSSRIGFRVAADL